MTFVAIEHHRRDLLVSAKVPDLVEADACFLALLDRHGDGAMSNPVGPQLDSIAAPRVLTIRSTLRVSRRRSRFPPRLPTDRKSGPAIVPRARRYRLIAFIANVWQLQQLLFPFAPCRAPRAFPAPRRDRQGLIETTLPPSAPARGSRALIASSTARTVAGSGPRVSRRRSTFAPGTSICHVSAPSMRVRLPADFFGLSIERARLSPLESDRHFRFLGVNELTSLERRLSGGRHRDVE